MRNVRPVLVAFASFSFLLLLSAGLSGCGSKPSDGSMVEDGTPISAEQKAKVKGFYADRMKPANKSNKKSGQPR